MSRPATALEPTPPPRRLVALSDGGQLATPIATIPTAGTAIAAREILGGGTLAVVCETDGGTTIEVVRLRGGVVHRIELPALGELAIARAGRALALSDAKAVLHVHAQFSMSSPRVTSFSIPGMESSLVTSFNRQRVMDCGLNTLYHLRVGDLDRVVLRWSLDQKSVEVVSPTAYHQELLVAYGLGRTSMPADPEKIHVGNRQNLVSLFSLYGDEGLLRGARRVVRELGKLEIEGVE